MKSSGPMSLHSQITRRLSPSGSAPMRRLSPAWSQLVSSCWRPYSNTTPPTGFRRSRPASTPTSGTAAHTTRAVSSATVVNKTSSQILRSISYNLLRRTACNINALGSCLWCLFFVFKQAFLVWGGDDYERSGLVQLLFKTNRI